MMSKYYRVGVQIACNVCVEAEDESDAQYQAELFAEEECDKTLVNAYWTGAIRDDVEEVTEYEYYEFMCQ